MAGHRLPGPDGTEPDSSTIDRGTSARIATPRPGPVAGTPAGPAELDAVIEHLLSQLQAQSANAGAHAVWDASARQAYTARVRALADELHAAARSGRISWAEAAAQAREVRDVTMALVRERSSPIGRAAAERIKPQSPSLNELVARKTLQMHGPGADFARLSAAQRDAVYAEVVRSAGKSNPRVNQAMQRLSRAGRALIVFSLAMSVYTVATADDKVAAAGKEVAVTGAGVLGGIGGGALAGLACGPGAPVCVAAGAFVGGALAAFGVEWFW
jgi:hypothetical protein